MYDWIFAAVFLILLGVVICTWGIYRIGKQYMYQLKDEKLKHELKNSLDKILTTNKIKDIESIAYEGSNIVATSDPAYFDISIRIKGHLEEKETVIKLGELKLSQSLLYKINQDKEKHGYKEIETIITDALDNYYEGC